MGNAEYMGISALSTTATLNAMLSTSQYLVLFVCVGLSLAGPRPPLPGDEDLERRDAPAIDAIAQVIADLLHLGAGAGLEAAKAACQGLGISKREDLEYLDARQEDGQNRDIFFDLAVKMACSTLTALANKQ